MSEQKKFKFHVIKLLEHPYIDPEKYVCVPNSWIRLRETSDGVAFVKFPVEELSEIKKRVEKQEFSENWTVFLANINYSTNSYEDGSVVASKIMNKISDQEQSSTKIVKDVPSTSDKKVLESQSGSETNKVRTTSTLKSDMEPVSKEIPKQLDLTNAEVRVDRKKSKVGTADSFPKAKKYLTRQSLRISFSGNNTISLPDQTTKDNLPKTSHCVKESDKTNKNQEKEPLAKIPSELMRKWQIIMALRAVFGDNFKETLKQLHSAYEKNQLMLEKMQLAFMENCKITKELIELTNEAVNGPDISDLDSVVKELNKSMMKVNINANNSDEATRSKVQNDTQKKEEKKHNSDNTEVKNNNPLKKIRGQARKFTLPPEYDPNDSRWTLKHREEKSGLVELLPYSRVYIDSVQLSISKITSKDSKTLARRLLLEIFTENALSICSFTGKKANAFDFEGTRVRPGLDEHARTILLNYVKKHAAEQNWDEFDSQLLSNIIRNKMQEMRGKHQNIDEK